MQGSWVSPCRHDECMDDKYTLESGLESFIENIYVVVISAKYSFISLFLHFN